MANFHCISPSLPGSTLQTGRLDPLYSHNNRCDALAIIAPSKIHQSCISWSNYLLTYVSSLARARNSTISESGVLHTDVPLIPFKWTPRGGWTVNTCVSYSSFAREFNLVVSHLDGVRQFPHTSHGFYTILYGVLLLCFCTVSKVRQRSHMVMGSESTTYPIGFGRFICSRSGYGIAVEFIGQSEFNKSRWIPDGVWSGN